MAYLSPQLHESIRDFCAPHLRNNAERESALWVLAEPTRLSLNYDTNPLDFTSQMIRVCDTAELQTVLRSLITGVQGQQTAETLCQAIATETNLYDAAGQPASPRHAYRQTRIAELADSRYQIDTRFVALTLIVDHGPEAQQRFSEQRSQQYNSLRTCLAELDDQAAIVLGAPGSGKTTLLRRLQLEHMWATLEQDSDHLSYFVPLNQYSPDAPDPLTWLSQRWAEDLPALQPFDSYLRHGRLLLLLDGLNEIPHRDRADYDQRVSQWQQFLQRHIKRPHQVVFSCRNLDYTTLLGRDDGLTVRRIQVNPLTRPQMKQFLEKYTPDEAARVWETISANERQLDLLANPFFLRLLVDQVIATGRIPTGRAALITGFIRRALRREIQNKNPLLRPDYLLDEEDIDCVIHEAWGDEYELPEEGPLIPAFERLAYAMQERQLVSLPPKEARQQMGNGRAKEIITAGYRLNVLDKDNRQLKYFHQLLQEYFAARPLAAQPELARLRVPWHVDEVTPSLEEALATTPVGEPLKPLRPTGWEESALMAAPMSAEPEGFIRALMLIHLPLAARCAASPEVQISERLKSELQQALLGRIQNSQTDLRARIQAAEALGELGDPRFERHTGPYGDYLLPPMVKIEGGTYTIGSKDGNDDEKPVHQVEIAPFEMDIFPVTNAEYALFIEAGGYEDEQWWDTPDALAWLHGEGSNEGAKEQWYQNRRTLLSWSDEYIRNLNVTPDQIDAFLQLKQMSNEEFEAQLEEWYPSGKVFREPEFWADSRFNHPAQPVVGITWFEARAYINWLSAQSGKTVVLPTEAEWEAAASGRDGRVYPYGQEHDRLKGNTFETHLRQTTPVGIFVEGQTPEGVFDLSGNVFEWTSSLYQPYPYNPQDGREGTAPSEARVLRGGSFGLFRNSARAAYRSHNHPVDRDANDGFRVCVRRPPSLT